MRKGHRHSLLTACSSAKHSIRRQHHQHGCPQSVAQDRVAKAACTERSHAKASLHYNLNLNRPATAVVVSASSDLRNKKSVRFNGIVKVCVKQVAQEDLSLTWYGPREYKDFQRDSKRSLKAVSNNLSSVSCKASPEQGGSGSGGVVDAYYDSSKHCLRGLEACVSNSIYQSRKEEKSKIVNQVLQQQLFQRILGVNDQDSLATLSQGLSKKAQERALVLAAIDSARDHQGDATAL